MFLESWVIIYPTLDGFIVIVTVMSVSIYYWIVVTQLLPGNYDCIGALICVGLLAAVRVVIRRRFDANWIFDIEMDLFLAMFGDDLWRGGWGWG